MTSPTTSDINWYVIYTKSRQEKKVAQQLEELGMQVFCPVLKKERQWSDRKKIIEEPLFRSYVFVACRDQERQQAFKAQGVVRYLYWLQQPAIVREAEIAAIRDLLGEFKAEEIEVQQFQPSDRIKVKSGPLMDHSGLVLSSSGYYVDILLDALQMKLRLDTRNNKLSKWVTT